MIHQKYANLVVFTFHTETAAEEEIVVSGKKSSDVSSSMIEIAYNPKVVPMDILKMILRRLKTMKTMKNRLIEFGV